MLTFLAILSGNIIDMYHFHNPYSLPYLSFYIDGKDGPSSHSFSPLNQTAANNHLSNEDYHLLTSVDLHTQTENPIISLAITTPIMFLFSALAGFIQSRTLQMLKYESSVNNRLMTTQAKIHMIYWPLSVLSGALIDNIYPLSSFTTPHFCTILRFFVNFCALSMILYSFYACLLRYLFCVHTERIDRFGKNRTISLVYWIFYTHTFVWALLTILTSFNLDRMVIINKCYGWMDRLYLLELNSAVNMWKRHFCALNSSDGK